jgi:hypothetical protein
LWGLGQAEQAHEAQVNKYVCPDQAQISSKINKFKGTFEGHWMSFFFKFRLVSLSSGQ